MNAERLTLEIVHDRLTYDPLTGAFTWKKCPPHHSEKIGKTAGNIMRGYVQIGLLGRRYLAHRVAWLYATGSWPLHEIDHIDRNKSNNAILNLREATRTQNNRNKIGRGYWLEKKNGTYRAQITIDNKNICLGTFPDEESARAAHVAANIRHYGSFSPYMERL